MTVSLRKKKMRMLACLAATAMLAVAASASADPTPVTFNGTLKQAGSFNGTLNLDVVNGKAVSGSGKINILSYTGATLTLITTSTPYNEDNSAAYPGALVGFRANDGTDLIAYDQAYPISTNGLLFAIGTSNPQPNGNPLIGLFSDGNGGYGAQFTGQVDRVEYYNDYVLTGVSVVAAAGGVPEPATWALMIVGFGAVGAAMRRRAKVRTAVSFA